MWGCPDGASRGPGPSADGSREAGVLRRDPGSHAKAAKRHAWQEAAGAIGQGPDGPEAGRQRTDSEALAPSIQPRSAPPSRQEEVEGGRLARASPLSASDGADERLRANPKAFYPEVKSWNRKAASPRRPTAYSRITSTALALAILSAPWRTTPPSRSSSPRRVYCGAPGQFGASL